MGRGHPRASLSGQESDHIFRQRHRSRTGLRTLGVVPRATRRDAAEVDAARLEVDVLPLEGQHLAATAASGEQ
jgi:hypothetical protein